MASAKNLEKKQMIIDEIKERIQKSNSVVLFDYRGITDSEAKDLRRALKNTDSDYKVYKNTLMARAFKDLNISIDESLIGPSAVAFGIDQIAPIKVLSDFAKKNKSLILKAGVIDGEVKDVDALNILSTIPSREGLLTMLAGGMIGLVKDLSICLDLYSKQKEN